MNLNSRQQRGKDYNADTLLVAEKLKYAIDMMGVLQSCINCNHFNEATEICRGVTPFTARPPARIIAYGCPSHSAEIPF
jgi:hypothetical protein